MPMTTSGVPAGVPLLSRGKHRNSRKGACFMELASFMAGESWSDRPGCTHPLLASLARLVNDFTSDAGRHHLAPLIPNVIGLTSDDPHVDVVIALRSATTALPVASEERQRALAVGVIVARSKSWSKPSGSGAQARAIPSTASRTMFGAPYFRNLATGGELSSANRSAHRAASGAWASAHRLRSWTAPVR